MGNEASSNGSNNGSVASPTGGGTTSGSFEESTAVSPGATRRIVKAVKPVASPDLGMPVNNGNRKGIYEDDADEDHVDLGGHRRSRRSVITHELPPPIHESPSLTRELELEKLKDQKQERLESMQEKQRERREKRLEERRHRNPGANPNEASLATDNGVAKVKPNPFSRFLSVFSVESKHPEHKRSYEVSANDEPEPDIKKPRGASMDEGEGSVNQGSSTTSLLLNGVFAATAAAVVAMAAGAFLRATRSKI